MKIEFVIRNIKSNLRKILLLAKDLRETLSPDEIEDADKVDEALLRGDEISDFDIPNLENVFSQEFSFYLQSDHFERLIYEEIAEPNKDSELLHVDIDKVREVMDKLPDEVKNLFWQIIRRQWYEEKTALISIKCKNSQRAIDLSSRTAWLGVDMEELIETIDPYCLDKS